MRLVYVVKCERTIVYYTPCLCLPMIRFKKGAFQMAKAAGVRVVPVSIGNLHRLLPANCPLPIAPIRYLVWTIDHGDRVLLMQVYYLPPSTSLGMHMFRSMSP